MRKTLVIGMTAVMVLMAFMASSPTAAAATWTVDDDGTADFSTIQAAINAASDGDTIIVHEGTYTEVITEFEGLTVKAVDGDTVTVQAGWNDIQVLDTTAPVITLNGEATMTLECGGTYDEPGATASDNCCLTEEISIVSNVDTTTVAPYTVTYDVADCTGNAATQVTRAVNVVDTTPPELIIETPPELIIEDDVITVEQETRDGTVVSLTATATDISDANPTITSDELAIYPLGTRTVTFTAIDAFGNTVTCTRTVTVVDTTPPELIIETPPELIIEDDVITVEQETRDGTVVSLTATATDISYASPTITSTKETYTLGTTTVTFMAIDDSDNSVSKSMKVHVIDTTPPDISVTVSPDTLWPPNHKMVDIVAAVPVSDISDPAPSVVLTSVTSDEPDDAKGNGDGKTVNDIQGAEIGTEDYKFQLRAERAGKGDGRIYTIVYTVTDASDNSASASTTVVVPHDMGE